MNNRETVRGITRYWQSGRREREAPAPARGRPVPPAHCSGCRPATTPFLPRQRRYPDYACLRHPNRKQQRPRIPGPLMPACNSRLFQRGVDVAELAFQGGTEAVDHSDNRERNAGCNQAVFDGGGAGLILPETRNQVLHQVTPCVHVAVELRLVLPAFSAP